jgi:hypothetical protein
MLIFFLGDTSHVFYAGSIVDPKSVKVGQALKLSAQAGAALFVCQPPGPPPLVEIGDGPLVHYDKPAPRELAAFTTWLDAFYLCLVARQAALIDCLCRVPNDVFRTSDVVGAADTDYDFADLLRAVWMQEHFTTDPVFDCVEASCQAQPAKAKYVHGVTIPFLRALRNLEARDESGFSEALSDGLRGHKAFYSTKKYRQEFSGLVSLMLTSVAALAYDRGMRFDVQSDYMPQSWVTGEVFRQTSPGP